MFFAGSHSEARRRRVCPSHFRGNGLRAKYRTIVSLVPTEEEGTERWGKPLLVRNFSLGGQDLWKINGKVPNSTFLYLHNFRNTAFFLTREFYICVSSWIRFPFTVPCSFFLCLSVCSFLFFPLKYDASQPSSDWKNILKHNPCDQL